MNPRALVITTAGINCDLELGHAFARAGAEVESRHLTEVLRDPGIIGRADLIGLPGGFSYGDAIAAGRVCATVMSSLADVLVAAAGRGVPIIAPCNGFQIAVQLGLLPGGGGARSVALAENQSGRFVDCWSRVEVPANTRCIWTQGLELSEPTALLPSAHGEGRFLVESDEVLVSLETAGQIAIRYTADDNPNGSAGHIAGICDPSGLILGLMPHPERYTQWTQHPFWTRLATIDHDPPGLQMFRNAVSYARSRGAAGEPASIAANVSRSLRRRADTAS